MPASANRCLAAMLSGLRGGSGSVFFRHWASSSSFASISRFLTPMACSMLSISACIARRRRAWASSSGAQTSAYLYGSYSCETRLEISLVSSPVSSSSWHSFRHRWNACVSESFAPSKLPSSLCSSLRARSSCFCASPSVCWASWYFSRWATCSRIMLRTDSSLRRWPSASFRHRTKSLEDRGSCSNLSTDTACGSYCASAESVFMAVSAARILASAAVAVDSHWLSLSRRPDSICCLLDSLLCL